jgi:hypothetical protein
MEFQPSGWREYFVLTEVERSGTTSTSSSWKGKKTKKNCWKKELEERCLNFQQRIDSTLNVVWTDFLSMTTSVEQN